MVDVYKRSQLNLYDAVDNNKHFKITQGETDCKMFVPNIYDLNCPQMKLTSGDQIVSNVASQILSNVADIAQESASRLSADLNLQGNIDNEASARTSADSALDAKITVEKNRITQEISDRTSAVSAESSARTSADQLLQENIDAEATSRLNADASEVSARTNADAVLQSNITAEATARANADTALENKINVEKARIDFIVSNTQVEALDSLTEIVSAFQSADNSLIAQVGALQTQLNALQSVVDALAENP
jgi:hypothetical protein